MDLCGAEVTVGGSTYQVKVSGNGLEQVQLKSGDRWKEIPLDWLKQVNPGLYSEIEWVAKEIYTEMQTPDEPQDILSE